MLEFQHNNFDDAKRVRTSVFIEEQGFKNEFDETDLDESCVHITAYVDGQLAGCSRIFPSNLEPGVQTEPGVWIFGRLAVFPEMRGMHLGSDILAESERVAQCAGATEMHLHAQCNAMPFYERSGYVPYGPIELDEHVEHRWMRKMLGETVGSH